MARAPDRVDLRMSRLHSGQYELQVGSYHFEMYSHTEDEDGAYGKPKTIIEWFGSINGHVVAKGEKTQEIKAILKPLVEKAHEVLRLERRREQGEHLLVEIFRVTNAKELPDNVREALSKYEAESVIDVDALMHEHMNDQPDSDETDEDDDDGADDVTIVRSL